MPLVSDIKPVLSTLLRASEGKLDPELRSQLEVMDSTKFGPDPRVDGNTAFWVSHSMVHRRHGWYMSARFRSRRAHGNEDFDTVAKSWHCGSGVLKVAVQGDEYDQTRARMDWHALPGVTEEWRDDDLPLLNDADMEGIGGNHFASGASDGQIGLAAFRYTHHELETSVHYSAAAANKAYFFLDDSVVGLGNSVRRIQSGQGRSIVTTLDQVRWRGAITFGNASSGAREVIAFDGDPLVGRLPSGGCARTVPIAPGETLFLHHGHVGYIVAPSAEFRSTLSLELRCGPEVQATDAAMADDTKWGNGRRWKNETEYWGSDTVFLAVLHHGLSPQNGTYQYAVAPGTASEIEQLARTLFDRRRVHVVRNDASVMALADLRAGKQNDNYSASAQVPRPRRLTTRRASPVPHPYLAASHLVCLSCCCAAPDYAGGLLARRQRGAALG